MHDTRPRTSAMPLQPRQIGEALSSVIRGAMESAHEAIVALDGDPAELENDALSVLAQLAALAGTQFMARLMLAKGIDAQSAWPTAVVEIQTRMQGILVDAAGAGQGTL